MKFCPRCSKTLPPSAFNRDRSNKDGLEHACRACRAARRQGPEAKLREKETGRAWREANPERRRQITARWRNRNRGLVQERDRNMKRVKAKENPMYGRYHRKKSHAKADGVPFELTEADFTFLMSAEACPLCDQPFSPVTHGEKTHQRMRSLDQLVPGRGYTTDNTVCICHGCNAAKSNKTLEQLKLLVSRLELLLGSPSDGYRIRT